jgi:hypothetical protein
MGNFFCYLLLFQGAMMGIALSKNVLLLVAGQPGHRNWLVAADRHLHPHRPIALRSVCRVDFRQRDRADEFDDFRLFLSARFSIDPDLGGGSHADFDVTGVVFLAQAFDS